ncbi:MAG: hypothetical protein HJJLKODD_01741 [Phycisphaerae bacterium]|nr:hypothetical protein [Phycisphaerae bacterium]
MAVENQSNQMVLKFRGRHWVVGPMVLVSVMVAAGLMVLLQRWALQAPIKWDLTRSRMNSLSPGTAELLNSLKDGKLYLTSLYLESDLDSDAQKKYREKVADLIRLYQVQNPAQVETRWINPIKEQVQFTEFLKDILKRPQFKKQTEPYHAALQAYVDEFGKPFNNDLLKLIEPLAQAAKTETSGGSPVSEIRRAVSSWAEVNNKTMQQIQRTLEQPLPEYTQAVGVLQGFYGEVGSKLKYFVEEFIDKQSTANALPAEVVAALQQAKPVLAEWVQRMNNRRQELSNLPPLDLDEVLQRLRGNNALVVATEQSARVISFEEMWPAKSGSFASESKFDDHLFAGEGVLTPTILQMLQQKKNAVIFTRRGGGAMFGTMGQGAMARPNPYQRLKDELEKLNYLVAEWDLATAAAPPAFNEEVDYVIFVIFRPGPTVGPQGSPLPGEISATERAAILSQLSDQARLENGARAIFITGYDSFADEYEFDEYLQKTWGVDVGTGMVLSAFPSRDTPGEWVLDPNWFPIAAQAEYADNPLVTRQKTLPTLYPLVVPITLSESPPEGVKLQQLAYLPVNSDRWTVEDAEQTWRDYLGSKNSKGRNFIVPATGANHGPFPLAIVGEKEKNKVAILAVSEEYLADQLAQAADLVNDNGVVQIVRKIPGNFALFTNLLRYLDGTEQWMNIGSGIDASRLELSKATRRWWQVMVMGIWPGMAVLLGGIVWLMRRR